MKKRNGGRGISMLLAAALACGTCVYGASADTEAETAEERKEESAVGKQGAETENSVSVAAAEFGLQLYRECAADGTNVMVSPLSVLAALGMTANGAEGETLAQMESAFGVTVPELNAYLESLTAQLGEAETGLQLANSIWLNRKEEEGTVKEEFLESCRTYYDAKVQALPFDGGALEQINQWVSDKTEGRIDPMLGEIDPGAVMYLINAMAFDGKWVEPYREEQIEDGTFTAEDGSSQDAELMFSVEDCYLKDDHAGGFFRDYDGKNYRLAVLLPEEGLTLEEYVSGLTGERLIQILENGEAAEVYAKLPKFESSYSAGLKEALQHMGIQNAFDGSADFSGMSDDALQISEVLHKTYIKVDEMGTEAAAATSVMIEKMALEPEEIKPVYEVYLDRPFLYLIIERQTNMPLFLGAVDRIETE